MKYILVVVGLLFMTVTARAELSIEPTGQVATLPVPYPKHWVLAHDAAFFHMTAGKMVLLDADAKTQPEQFKGMIDISLVGSFIESATRQEMYVAETFYSRGARGIKTDVVTIYNKSDLAPIDEIVLPGGKKSSTMPEKYSFQLIDNEKLLLVFNLTPATSVTVIDIVKRKVLGEIPTPGCSLIYPTGKRGFSSLCANGSLYSVQIDSKGKISSNSRLPVFFDVDNDPLFEKPAYVKGIAYFSSFRGQVYPIDMSDKKPKLMKRWSLLNADERKNGWRPGGWQLNAVDTKGKMYILMHSSGKNGSHKSLGSEVWVYDVNKKIRVDRIKLKTPGMSIAVTNDSAPLMLVTNQQMGIDVYTLDNKQYKHTMNFGQETPFVVYPVK